MVVFAIHITQEIKRKWTFWKQFFPIYFLYLVSSCHFYYLYWIFKNENKQLDIAVMETYINSEIMMSWGNSFVFSNLFFKCNEKIAVMNIKNSGSVVNKEDIIENSDCTIEIILEDEGEDEDEDEDDNEDDNEDEGGRRQQQQRR